MDWRTNKKLDTVTAMCSDEHEAQIRKAHTKKQPVVLMRVNLNAKSLHIPKVEKNPARQLEFTDKQNIVKALLYRTIVAAYNYVFFNEFAAVSGKESFTRVAQEFVVWLNKLKIENKYNLLKEYETHWFDVRDNHGGPSPLTRLKTVLFHYSYHEVEFCEQLSQEDAAFLKVLQETKISAQTNKRQDSLANYFGALPWLRDQQLGIGSDLYRVFASPKLTVNSLKILASTLILEFYDAKVALQKFLFAHDYLLEDISNTLDGINNKCTNGHQQSALYGKAIFEIISAYHDLESRSLSLQKGISLLLISNLSTKGLESYQLFIESKNSLYSLFEGKRKRSGRLLSLSIGRFSTFFSSSNTADGPMVSMLVLHQLTMKDTPLPITQVERLMFSWLMASLAVQPYDIVKLKKNNFRLLKVGQRVTNIECEYFKSRANYIHTTRSLSVKKIEGQALLTFLNQNPDTKMAAFNNSTPSTSPGNNSVLGNLVAAIKLPMMDAALRDAHSNNGDIPMVVPMAIQSIIKYGISLTHKKGLTNKDVKKASTFCSSHIFGLQAIKNSSVHANSDPYTLHYLINHNSHSNQTEKSHYLNEYNEEWINASGRITRTVMLDLINNVFDIDFSRLNGKDSKEEVARFNNEFESVTQSISYKSEEMLSRLHVVTGQKKGRINEVGVLSKSTNKEEGLSPIYILDSPVTVCKMRNYLYEFNRNYLRLLNQNSHYLYQTVLPTVEWMQQVLSTELSSESINEGEKLFMMMQKSGVSMTVFHSI